MGQVQFGKQPSNNLHQLCNNSAAAQFEFEVETDKTATCHSKPCSGDLQINVYQSSSTQNCSSSNLERAAMDYQLVPFRSKQQCDYPVEYITPAPCPAPRQTEYFVPVDCRPRPRPCEYQPAPVCYTQPAPVQRCAAPEEGFWVEEDTLYMPTEVKGRQGCLLDGMGRGFAGEIIQAVRQGMDVGRPCSQPQYRMVTPAPAVCRPKVITTYVEPCPPPPPPPQPVQIPAIIYYDPCSGAVTGTAGAGAQAQIMSSQGGGVMPMMGGYPQPIYRNGRRMRSFLA